jgi:hypothetical protein
MPSNRFDTSQPQEYVSQHVPLPFEAIAALGEKTQKAHDAAIDDTYKLKDLMTKVPAIYDPNLGLSNIQKKKELDAQFAPKIDDLTNKIMAGDVNATRELEQLKRDFANNPVRQELENSYVDYQAYKKDMVDKKDAYAIYKDPYRNKALINEAGELQPFRYSGMGEIQDHASEARDQMKDIAKMGYDSKNSTLNLEDGNIYTKDSHGKYIKDTRVRELANRKAKDFIQTEKGKDFLELIKYQNPNATPQELYKHVSDYLYNAGSNQVFSDIGGGTDVQTTSLTGKKYDEKVSANISTTNEQGNPETINVDNILNSWGLNNIFDKDGVITAPSMFDSKYVVTNKDGVKKEFNTSKEAHEFAGKTGVITQQKRSNGESADGVIHNAYSKIMPVFKSLGLKVPPGGTVAKTLHDYANTVALQRSTTTQLQQSTIKGMTNFFLGDNSNISNMEVYEQGNEDFNAKLTNETMGSLAKNSKITGVDYFSNNKAGWKIAVTPKDGDGKIVGKDKALIAIPRDLTFESETKPVYNISKGALEFAKTGKENSKYMDQAAPVIQEKLTKEYGVYAPKIIASSTERNKNGEVILRGSYVDNSNNQADMKGIEYNVSKGTFELLSLGEIQKRKTQELETKGALQQYNVKLGETIKDSEVNP